jgi:hypothetical protein
MRAALEATMTNSYLSMPATISTMEAAPLPTRFDGESLLIGTVLLFAVVITALIIARWRATQRLVLPGLKEVHAWERLASAQAVDRDRADDAGTATGTATATVTDSDVRILRSASPQMSSFAAAAASSTSTPTPGSIWTSTSMTAAFAEPRRITAPTVVPFTELRSDLRERTHRTHLRLTGLVLVVTTALVGAAWS